MLLTPHSYLIKHWKREEVFQDEKHFRCSWTEIILSRQPILSLTTTWNHIRCDISTCSLKIMLEWVFSRPRVTQCHYTRKFCSTHYLLHFSNNENKEDAQKWLLNKISIVQELKQTRCRGFPITAGVIFGGPITIESKYNFCWWTLDYSTSARL